MALDVQTIQNLLDEIASLKRGIETAGNAGRTRLSVIDVEKVLGQLPVLDGKLDAARWEALKPETAGTTPGESQSSVHEVLVQLRDSLRAATDLDGPSDIRHIMHYQYASNRAIVAGMALSIATLVGLLGFVIWRWGPATNTDFASHIDEAERAIGRLRTADSVHVVARAALSELILAGAPADTAGVVRVDLGGPLVRTTAVSTDSLRTLQAAIVTLAQDAATARREAGTASIGAVEGILQGGATELNVLLMVALLGALGGSVHVVSSLVTYIGNRQLLRSWLAYYLSIPFAAATFATIVYMLLRVGILTPTGAGGDGSGTANLNLIAIYAFAALTGLFAKTAGDKLKEVFETMFARRQTPPTKDAAGGGGSGGGSAT